MVATGKMPDRFKFSRKKQVAATYIMANAGRPCIVVVAVVLCKITVVGRKAAHQALFIKVKATAGRAIAIPNRSFKGRPIHHLPFDIMLQGIDGQYHGLGQDRNQFSLVHFFAFAIGQGQPAE